MKLWAKRGKSRLWEIREVSMEQLTVENHTHMHQGGTSIGVPYCYATTDDGIRLYVPSPSKNVQIEEEE